MPQWYRQVVSDVIDFQPSPDRYWPPDVIRRDPLPIEAISEKEVEITGSGAMWMYAHAAAAAAASGKNVRVTLAAQEGDSEDTTGSLAELRLLPPYALFEISLAEEPRLKNSAIISLISEKLNRWPSSNIQELCITGRANGVAYAHIAAEAVRRGVERIYCWTPTDGSVLIYDRRQSSQIDPETFPDWLLNFLDPPKCPVVVGVLGDPNCGKSVLSLALNHYRRQLGIRGWRLDCDGASPTPDWYLSSLETNPEEAKEKRRAIKRPWTEAMEDQIAKRLHRLRDFFDIAIADLPGGDHSKSPPERVPKHREVILKEVDAFILLERVDRPTIAEWENELRNHGLSERVVAKLGSTAPEAEPCLSIQLDDSGVWCGQVSGLDRQKRPEHLVQGLKSGFQMMWPSLLKTMSAAGDASSVGGEEAAIPSRGRG